MREKTVNLILMRFGKLGRAFFLLLQERSRQVRNKYGMDLNLRAIFRAHSGLFSLSEIKLKDVPDLSAPETAPNAVWKPGLGLEDVLRKVKAGVVVECTPSNINTGEPNLRHIIAALDNGWNVASANKGPLAVAFKKLKQKADDNRVQLKFSGAAALLKDIINIYR